MEPSGRFMLYALPDGQTIAELKLEAEAALRDLTLLEYGPDYLLLTSDSEPERAVGLPGGMQMPGGDRRQSLAPSKPVRQGRLYAIDGHGKLLWPKPVKIENQRFILNQPADLPVLTFACRRDDYDEAGQYTGLKTAILCIDKRSGRTVYKAEGYENPSSSYLRIAGDVSKNTIEVMTADNTVTLTLTDKPLRDMLRGQIVYRSRPPSRSRHSTLSLRRPISLLMIHRD